MFGRGMFCTQYLWDEPRRITVTSSGFDTPKYHIKVYNNSTVSKRQIDVN